MPRTNSCLSCFYYDWHRSGTSLGHVTITIAAPGVITATGLAPMVDNTPVVLSTTGALPTGLSSASAYYVIPIDADTFQIAATPNGAAITTTGTQSGTHTCELVIMGCHLDAPQGQAIDTTKNTWRPVDPDYWCGEGADSTSGQSFSSAVTNLPASQNYSPAASLTYTPTITSSGGTITTASATGHYFLQGKLVHFSINITITTNGTGSGLVEATLPVVPTRNAAAQGHDVGTDAILSAIVAYGGGNLLAISTAAGAYPGADGKVLVVSGEYETS